MNRPDRPNRARGHQPPPGHIRKNTVNNPLTPKRVRGVVENDEYAAFARRILRAYARRVATGDIDALTQMTTLADDIETAIRNAVVGLREFGYSWADIGARLSVTRQAAQQRWGGWRPESGVNRRAWFRLHGQVRRWL